LAFCNKCGSELATDARFCHKCGAPVTMTTPPTDLHRVLKVTGKPRVVIKQRVPGRVEVKPGAAGEVTVDIEPKPPETVIWNIYQDGNVITISFRIREFIDWPGHFLSGSPQTNIHVIVPSESDLDIRNRVDRVSVTGISGMLAMESSAGIISVQNCTGVIQARTRAGGIELGNIKGTVSAETSAGPIAFSGSLSKGENWFRTRVGDINLTLQGEHDVRVEGYTTIGRVTVTPELDGARFDGREYVGKIGAGTGRLVAQTTAGSITIKQLGPSSS
jgi:zinc ribbon protein/putative adhesin